MWAYPLRFGRDLRKGSLWRFQLVRKSVRGHIAPCGFGMILRGVGDRGDHSRASGGSYGCPACVAEVVSAKEVEAVGLYIHHSLKEGNA